MFADVMVRVIGVSYFTSVPSTVSEPEDSNPSGGVCSCSPARNTTVTPDILVFPSLSSTGVLFSSTLFNPSTGPSTGPSLMASITLSSCVDFRLSFASRGVCDAPRDKCTLSCAINGIHAAFHYLKKNYISGCVMTVPTGW
ncbi:glucosamine-6-phosphate deaminase [Escherichia coli O78:H12 str. 00-3279]|nr:glucosamine-6-phosphate deaminase [Escherichia coli O78:H12 str. 00-3279]